MKFASVYIIQGYDGMKCDVLSLELYSSGRDIDIVEPVLVYLEYKYSIEIVRCDGYNFEYYLFRYRPRLLLISNSVGSYYKVSAVKLASLLGIKVVSLVSEGTYCGVNFDELDNLDELFFGENKEKVLYEDLNLVWNDIGYQLAEKVLSRNDMNRIKVSGATLFDKYFIFNEKYNKTQWLQKRDLKEYEKIVLITTWTFSLLYGGYFKRNEQVIYSFLGGKEWLEFHRRNGHILREIYQKVIEKHPDILFIIKIHPCERDNDVTDISNSEYYGLDLYNNVYVVEPYTDDIIELISISDILLSYDSTTGMEAWLMNTPAIFINPYTEKFPREIFYEGVAIAKSIEDLELYLEEFYHNGYISTFEKKYIKRKQINTSVMKYTDGQNHIRVGDEVVRLLKEPTKKRKITCFVLLSLIKGIGKKVLNYKPKNYIYSYLERYLIYEKYKHAMISFFI